MKIKIERMKRYGDAMGQEWELWQEIVRELKNIGIDINEQDRLCNLLNDWTQTYHLMKTDHENRKQIRQEPNLER